MKQVFSFVCLIMAVLSFGGFAYLIYDKHYLFAVAVAAVMAMAAPYVIKRFKELLNA